MKRFFDRDKFRKQRHINLAWAFGIATLTAYPGYILADHVINDRYGAHAHNTQAQNNTAPISTGEFTLGMVVGMGTLTTIAMGSFAAIGYREHRRYERVMQEIEENKREREVQHAVRENETALANADATDQQMRTAIGQVGNASGVSPNLRIPKSSPPQGGLIYKGKRFTAEDFTNG